jgi:hypothetical protein
MRNLFMDCWNIWPRLTFYRCWKDEYGNVVLDGTNNHCERANDKISVSNDIRFGINDIHFGDQQKNIRYPDSSHSSHAFG